MGISCSPIQATIQPICNIYGLTALVMSDKLPKSPRFSAYAN